MVGMGASAGGLEPLKTFFDFLPEKPGMAFIVIVHLSPNHESSLTEILQTQTSLKVLQVDGKTEINPDHVYIIPPDKQLLVTDNHLELSDMEKKEKKPQVIDQLFRSMGKVKGSNSACIILSGTGSDGAAGLKTVKENGGLTIVQDPEEAQYSQMPQSAITTGLVDMALPVKKMAAELSDYKKELAGARVSDDPDGLSKSQQKTLSKILTQLRDETDYDFSHYKRSTVLRRIDRRMHVHRVDSLAGYLSTLNNNPEEAHDLFKDLLISVTNFFRDPEAFEALENNVIPKLFEGKHRDDQLRVWVPGCATGEEAYSIAMLLHEYAGGVDNPPELQIFATDIDEEALHKARHGKYPESVTSDLTSERLEQFFVNDGYEYQVKEDLRSMILFTKHDMLGNPPFSNLDMVSCRNLLIYLNRKLQGEVFNLFHYSLRSEGFLFLGNSDSNLEASELFTPFDKQHSIYRQSSRSESKVHLPDFPLRFNKNKLSASHSWKTTSKTKTDFEKLHYILISRHYAPSSVIINTNYEVLHAAGKIDQYLKYTSGEPSRNILEMVIPELRHPLRAIFFHLRKEEHNQQVCKSTQVKEAGGPLLIELTVHKIKEADFPDDLMYVVFNKKDDVKSDKRKKIADNETVSDGDVEIIEELEEELDHTKEQLHITVEDYETSNEELRSSNEELQSMNEELQSATEELETSQEELHSVNEELKSVNRKLEVKIGELQQSNNDLKNLMETTEVGIIFVDRDLCIQRFTADAGEIFNLIATDLGRPLAHLTHQLDYDGLLEDVKHVANSRENVKKIVAGNNGRWYRVRITLYKTTKENIEGVVMSFVDITELKQQATLESNARQQESLAQLGMYALAGKKLDDIVHRAMQMVCEIIETDYILFLEVNKQQNTLHIKEAIGLEKETLQTRAFDIDEKSDAVFAFDNRNPVIVEDYSQQERFKPLPIIEELPITSGVSVGVKGIGTDYGVLQTYTTEKRTFSKHSLNFLQVVANLIGEAVKRKQTESELQTANKQLEDEVKRSKKFQREILNSSINERWKLGGYLHDNLAQMLAFAKILVSDINGKIAKSKTDISSEVSKLNAIIDESMRGVRDLTHDIIPIDVEEEGVKRALRFLIQQTRKLHEVDCTLETDEVINEIKNKELATHLYHVVQEAIKNAAVHGQAKNIMISIKKSGESLILKVTDDGKGFSNLSNNNKGKGIRIMEHRMDRVGGSCDIKDLTEDGQTGTCVHCKVSLKNIEKQRL